MDAMKKALSDFKYATIEMEVVHRAINLLEVPGRGGYWGIIKRLQRMQQQTLKRMDAAEEKLLSKRP